MVFVAIYDVQVAFRETPMRHHSPVYMVQLVEENPSLEVMEFRLNLITFMIQVGYLDRDRSFDHSANTWKAWVVLPSIFFVCSFSYNLWVHVYVVVIHF